MVYKMLVIHIMNLYYVNIRVNYMDYYLACAVVIIVFMMYGIYMSDYVSIMDYS